MIKVVVVEDEMLVRIGMKMCINEYDSQLKVVEDFSSGEEALEYLKHNMADVLVTDIRLGGMTGLDLIRQLRACNCQMVIIILSCYEDFSYAKEAIALGVNSYVLKHEIGEEELPKLILEQCQLQQAKFVPGILSHIKDDHRKGAEEIGEAFLLAVFVLRQSGERHNTTGQEISFEILQEILQKHLKDEGLGECFTYHEQEVWAIFRFERRENLAEGRERIQRFWREAISSVENYFNRNLYMVVSRPYYDIGMTWEVYQEALTWRDQSFYYEKPFCLWLEDICQSNEELPDLKLLREDMFREAWYRDMCYETGLFLQRCGNRNLPVKETKFKIIRLLNEIELYLEQNYGGLTYQDIFGEEPYLDYLQVDGFDSAAQLQKGLLGIFESLMYYIERQNDSFQSIEQYIRDNYAHQITLADMAEKFHMNSVYFCQYFKKKKGITYVQFLNQLRIEEAKKLLRTGEASIEQIAEKTGISNANYFGRLFKKMTGMTVGEYRKIKIVNKTKKSE